MIKTGSFIILFSMFGNFSLGILQVQRMSETDPTSLLIAAVTGLVATVVTIFFIYRKEVKERNEANEKHSKHIQDIYEKVVSETNVNINNNNRLTNENIAQVKELREAIQRLPKELREALKDR